MREMIDRIAVEAENAGRVLGCPRDSRRGRRRYEECMGRA